MNQRDMRMAEIAIRDAIRDGAEATITVTPIYKAARIDPNKFLVSVRWKSENRMFSRLPTVTTRFPLVFADLASLASRRLV